MLFHNSHAVQNSLIHASTIRLFFVMATRKMRALVQAHLTTANMFSIYGQGNRHTNANTLISCLAYGDAVPIARISENRTDIIYIKKY